MKSLKLYLEELFATPANTIGMGNITVPGPNGEIGSGDIPLPPDTKKIKRKKRFKRYKI